ncbi:sodium:solute symporter [Thalassoglobus sp.]|uniref:sodium:solute symporter n=1 Tax=Thalassoglobus sp. TaxID=2795869 RepID=UPI003AA91B23
MSAELGPIDVVVLISLLLAAIAIGFWSGRKNTDVESYLLGGRSLPWWAILGSIVATETSTATVLSVPGVAFGDAGMKWLQIAFGYIVGRMVVVQVFLPLYFKGKLLTAYQVLDSRFGTATKTTASLLFLVTRNLGDGLRLFLAGIVLHTLLGWPFVNCVIAMGVVTIFYTFFGGLRSVVWNDCIQFVIYMLGGVAALFIIASQVPEGWSQIWTFAETSGKLKIIETKFLISDPYNIWAGMIGGAVLTIGTHGTDHMMVQRYLSARSQGEAGRAVFLSSLVVLVQFALFLFIGVELACYYSLDGNVAPEKADQVFAHFIVNQFPRNTGLIGLILAAILAAAMSTLSSSLNASSSAFLNDFYVPNCQTPPDDHTQLKISRWLTVGFGVLQIGIGVWAISLERTVVNNALTIAGFSAGLLLGIFSLGVLTKRASQKSAIGGAFVGLIVLIIVQFVLKNSDGNPLVAWPWIALIGSVTTFSVGMLISFIFPQKQAVIE